MSTLGAYAQRKINWNINLGGSVPIGEFSQIEYNPNNISTNCGLFEDDTKGAAVVGVNVGTELLFKLKNDKFSILLSADLHYNGIKGDAKAYLTDAGNYIANYLSQQLSDSGATVINSFCTLEKTPSYINIPIMAGIRYTHPLFIGMDAFAEASIGINIRYITSNQLYYKLKYYFPETYEIPCTITETLSYENASTFSFRFGGGICLTDFISISFHYYYLGNGNVLSKLNTETTIGNNSHITSSEYYKLKSITPTMLVIKLGFTF